MKHGPVVQKTKKRKAEIKDMSDLWPNKPRKRKRKEMMNGTDLQPKKPKRKENEKKRNEERTCSPKSKENKQR